MYLRNSKAYHLERALCFLYFWLLGRKFNILRKVDERKVSFIIPYPYSLAIAIPLYVIIIYDLLRIMPKDVACQNCSNLNPQGSSFCGKCGSMIK